MKLLITILLACFLFGCQTIENKADKIGKKEIKKISKFLQQPESELKIALGEPDDGLRAPLRRGVVLFIYSGVVPRRAGPARFRK